MRWLRALYVSNGLAVGSLYGFIPVLLQARGFDPALVGVATGLGSAAYTTALPVWGHIGDKIAGPRRTMLLICLPAALFGLGLGAPLPVWAVIVCQVAMSMASGPAMALTDAMAVPTLYDPSREYTRLRLLTSCGAAASAAGGGVLYTAFGYMVAPIAYAFVMAATLISAYFVKVGGVPVRLSAEIAPDGVGAMNPAPMPAPRSRTGSIGEAFAIRPRLFGILASVILIFTGIMAGGTYITLRVSDLGGGPLGVGLSNGIGWMAEAPGMLLAGWMIARFGARSVMAVCASGIAACIGSWVVLTDLPTISVTRFASGIFFAGIFVSFVLTIASILPPRLQSTGQTLLQASCFGFAAIVANFAGGLLYQQFGALGVFGVGAVCAAMGGILGLVVMPAQSEADPATVAPAEPSMA